VDKSVSQLPFGRELARFSFNIRSRRLFVGLALWVIWASPLGAFGKSGRVWGKADGIGGVPE